MSYAWLPVEIDWNSYGQWEPFVAELYRVFRRDFVDSQASVQGMSLNIKRRLDDGKEETFWHLVSRNYKGHGSTEEDRMPDIPRCRKLPWARAILDALAEHPHHADIRFWVQPEDVKKGRRDTRYKIALADFQYVIIIVVRRTDVLMVTAFPPDSERYRHTLRKEYRECGGQ